MDRANRLSDVPLNEGAGGIFFFFFFEALQRLSFFKVANPALWPGYRRNADKMEEMMETQSGTREKKKLNSLVCTSVLGS